LTKEEPSVWKQKESVMSHRREFEIAFVGLKPGIHEYEYEIKDKFFEAFQQQDFRNCKADVKLSLDKKSSFMLLKFEIGGSLKPYVTDATIICLLTYGMNLTLLSNW